MLYEEFLKKDHIHQTKIDAAIEKINEEAEEKQLIVRLKKVDAPTISRMMSTGHTLHGEFRQGKTLVEQLYAIFYALKENWHLDLLSDRVRELLQLIPE